MAEVRDHGGDRRFGVLELGDVGGIGARLDALGAELVGGRLGDILHDIHDRQFGALLGQALADRLADAPGSARHQRHFARDTSIAHKLHSPYVCGVNGHLFPFL